MLTLIEILKKSEEYLARHGIKDARHNAELIVSHILNRSRLDLYLEYDKPVEEDKIIQIRNALLDRKKHKPVQYIFGETEFFGLKFKLTPDVLIPRPETELLVEEALKSLKMMNLENPIVYDIGTGSGCIGISIAKNCLNCFVYASDISSDAIRIASANSIYNGVADKMKFFLGPDLKPFFNASAQKADIIIINPPYIKTGDIQKLDPEVRDFEPIKALDGGVDGFSVIKIILNNCPDAMKVGSLMMMEIGFGQSKTITELIKNNERLVLQNIVKDYQGIDRIVILKLK